MIIFVDNDIYEQIKLVEICFPQNMFLRNKNSLLLDYL